jgi:hypothetical protein
LSGCGDILRVSLHCLQRKRLGVVGKFEFRQPITEVDDCNIADVLFISQIYNVKPELKHNKEQMLRIYSSSPNNAKPNVARSAFPTSFCQTSSFIYWFYSMLQVKKRLLKIVVSNHTIYKQI